MATANQYWHNTITDKSFQALIKLNQKFEFILIGGWAVYFYTHQLKSKDIDIIVDYSQLGKLKEKYPVRKNDRLKKYEINWGEFDIDIYLPHYSNLGCPIEKVIAETQKREGFVVPKIEVLLALKLFAYSERKNSIKGKKDKIDIFSILSTVEIDWEWFRKFGQNFSLDLQAELKQILQATRQVPELNLNAQKMAKLKKGLPI